MATSTRRTATPDPEDVLLTDSEPEDLPSDESVKVTRGNLERGVTWNKIFLWLLTAKQAHLQTLRAVLFEGKLGSFLTCTS